MGGGVTPGAAGRTHVDHPGGVALLEVVEDGGLVEERQHGHVLNAVEFRGVLLHDLVLPHRHRLRGKKSGGRKLWGEGRAAMGQRWGQDVLWDVGEGPWGWFLGCPMSDGGGVRGLDILWDFGEDIWGSRCPTRFWRRYFGGSRCLRGDGSHI